MGAVKTLMAVFMTGSDLGRGFNGNLDLAFFRVNLGIGNCSFGFDFDFVALLLGSEVVDGDFFDTQGSAEVKRELGELVIRG